MIKRFLNGIFSLLLLLVAVFFVLIVASLFASEVSPALRQGTFDIETSIMILNHVWEGNELYILLGLYSLLASACGYAAIRFGAKAIGK